MGLCYGIVLCIVGFAMGTWTDEEYTLATTAHGLVYAWHRAIDYELQAPLYFAFVAAWRLINPSVWFARLFSILVAVGFYAACLRIGRRIAPQRDSLPFALLVSLNPFVVYAALEIRVYALGLLLSALVWLTFDGGFARDTRWSWRVAFVVLAASAMYVQYFIGFLVVGLVVGLVIFRGLRKSLPAIFACAAIGIAILPLLGFLRSQVGGSGTTDESMASLVWATIDRPIVEFAAPLSESWHLPYLNGIHEGIFLAIVVAIAAVRPRLDRFVIGTVVTMLVVDASYVASVYAFRLELVERHFIALFIAVACAGYAVIDATLARNRSIGIASVVTYTVFAAVTLYSQDGSLAKSGDVKRIDATLQASSLPGDRIAVFPADALPAYARYYRGTTPLIPFPTPVPDGRYDLGTIEVKSEADASKALGRLTSLHHVWFVMQGACRDQWSIYYGCDHVLRALHGARAVELPGPYFDGRLFEVEGRAPRTPQRLHSPFMERKHQTH